MKTLQETVKETSVKCSDDCIKLLDQMIQDVVKILIHEAVNHYLRTTNKATLISHSDLAKKGLVLRPKIEVSNLNTYPRWEPEQFAELISCRIEQMLRDLDKKPIFPSTNEILKACESNIALTTELEKIVNIAKDYRQYETKKRQFQGGANEGDSNSGESGNGTGNDDLRMRFRAKRDRLGNLIPRQDAENKGGEMGR